MAWRDRRKKIIKLWIVQRVTRVGTPQAARIRSKLALGSNAPCRGFYWGSFLRISFGIFHFSQQSRILVKLSLELRASPPPHPAPQTFGANQLPYFIVSSPQAQSGTNAWNTKVDQAKRRDWGCDWSSTYRVLLWVQLAQPQPPWSPPPHPLRDRNADSQKTWCRPTGSRGPAASRTPERPGEMPAPMRGTEWHTPPLIVLITFHKWCVYVCVCVSEREREREEEREETAYSRSINGAGGGGRGGEGADKFAACLFTCKSSAPAAASPRLGPGRSLWSGCIPYWEPWLMRDRSWRR